MDIGFPPEVPLGAAILIFIPYFVATIAAILYTNKQIKKGSSDSENSNKNVIRSNNSSD